MDNTLILIAGAIVILTIFVVGGILAHIFNWE